MENSEKAAGWSGPLHRKGGGSLADGSLTDASRRVPDEEKKEFDVRSITPSPKVEDNSVLSYSRHFVLQRPDMKAFGGSNLSTGAIRVTDRSSPAMEKSLFSTMKRSLSINGEDRKIGSPSHNAKFPSLTRKVDRSSSTMERSLSNTLKRTLSITGDERKSGYSLSHNATFPILTRKVDRSPTSSSASFSQSLKRNLSSLKRNASMNKDNMGCYSPSKNGNATFPTFLGQRESRDSLSSSPRRRRQKTGCSEASPGTSLSCSGFVNEEFAVQNIKSSSPLLAQMHKAFLTAKSIDGASVGGPLSAFLNERKEAREKANAEGTEFESTMNRVQSQSDLPVLDGKEDSMTRVHSMPEFVEQEDQEQIDMAAAEKFADTNPDEFFKTVIEGLGYPSEPISVLTLENYFLEYTSEQIAAYDNEVVRAVRTDNIAELRRLMHNGKIMQCSNRFGESLFHMACRKGSFPVVKFLVEEAQVCIRIHDDFGRTPLHDACWSSESCFEGIRMLIEKEPDLLLLADKRGHTPLQYVTREKWGEWCCFLDGVKDILQPKKLAKQKAM